jgi:hypothetical protein
MYVNHTAKYSHPTEIFPDISTHPIRLFGNTLHNTLLPLAALHDQKHLDILRYSREQYMFDPQTKYWKVVPVLRFHDITHIFIRLPPAKSGVATLR